MFGKTKKNEGVPMGLSSNTSTTLISKNTEVVGDIHFSGTLHIEGTLRGDIHVREGDDAHLEVAENGRVEGQIHVPTVRINGHVVGNIHSTKHVELAAKAVVEGDVHYKLIEMVKGSQVNGSLVYDGDEAKKKQAVSINDAKAAVASSKSSAGNL